MADWSMTRRYLVRLKRRRDELVNIACTFEERKRFQREVRRIDRKILLIQRLYG